MTKISEAAERIKSLRESMGETQEQFARRVGVKAPTISAWEKGDKEYAAGPGGYLALANVSMKFHHMDDALWFWERAGLDVKAMFIAMHGVLKIEPGEVIQALLRKLPSKMRWQHLDEKNARPAFAPGDVVLLDESEIDAPDLRPFWDQIVLVEFGPRAERTAGEWAQVWIEGFFMGRLTMKEYVTGWKASLCPFSEDRNIEGIPLGFWFPRSEQVNVGTRQEQMSHARANLRLAKGCCIRGRAVAWFSGSGMKK